jgi:hypothetical protein
MIQIDMPMPNSCYECLFQTDPCAACAAAEMTYGETFPSCTIPYCYKNPQLSEFKEGQNPYANKPDWCPLKEVE